MGFQQNPRAPWQRMFANLSLLKPGRRWLAGRQWLPRPTSRWCKVRGHRMGKGSVRKTYSPPELRTPGPGCPNSERLVRGGGWPQKRTTRWCNGNTRDFGSLVPGSSPGRVAGQVCTSSKGSAKLDVTWKSTRLCVKIFSSVLSVADACCAAFLATTWPLFWPQSAP